MTDTTTVKKPGFFSRLFGAGAMKMLTVVVVLTGLAALGRLGIKAYQNYTANAVTVEVLSRENARVKQAQVVQAQQYQDDLATQRVVFQKISQDQSRQITTLASRVDRVQKLDRDFAQAQRDVANVRPEDDADAAPVLDNAIDFLRTYQANAGSSVAGSGDAH